MGLREYHLQSELSTVLPSAALHIVHSFPSCPNYTRLTLQLGLGKIVQIDWRTRERGSEKWKLICFEFFSGKGPVRLDWTFGPIILPFSVHFQIFFLFCSQFFSPLFHCLSLFFSRWIFLFCQKRSNSSNFQCQLSVVISYFSHSYRLSVPSSTPPRVLVGLKKRYIE